MTGCTFSVNTAGMAFSQDQFRAIISGRRRDAAASVATFLLWVASLGYRLVVSIRNTLYNRRILRTHRVDCVVMSVGNLTTGGTGKTPLVAWLTKYVQSKGFHVAMLTRGYRARRTEDRGQRAAHNGLPSSDIRPPSSEFSDEPAELASACPGVPIIVNPDRVAGAAEAIHHHGAQVLVLDDGFQHRRLGRDLDIVTIDATEPFGYGRLLPAGLLREPLSGLHRAQAVVLTRCDQVAPMGANDDSPLHEIEETVRRFNPNVLVARSIHAPTACKVVSAHPASQVSLTELKDKKVFAFCGIGNPDGFVRTVESCGCRIVGKRIFDDHQTYSNQILADLHAQARSSDAELLLTTQKDWTKIAPLDLPDSPPALAYLIVELQFTSGSEALTALIERALAGRISTRCTNDY